jgi:hypothetical protein
MMFRLDGPRQVTRAAAITIVALSLPLALSAPRAAMGSTRAASPAAGGSVQADAAPPTPVTLQVQTVNGSGCPAGTAHVTAEANNTGFRVTYDDFIAEDGGSAGVTDFRKACQISVLVHIPQGFTFAVAEAENRGRLNLPAGASALARTNYYLTGSPDNNYVDHPFSGPVSGSWRTTDETPVVALIFAPCGANYLVNLVEELRVNAGTSNKPSFISMRRTEGDVDTFVQFQWKEC